MRRSGKLSVRARASVPMGAHTVLVWDVATYVRTPMRARACVCLRLRVLVQARQLGPAGASRTFIGGYAQVHSRPPAPRSAPAFSKAPASGSLPPPLRSTPRFYSACLGTHGRGIVAGRSRRAACRSTVL
jgi:hypothetical protein